MPWARRHGARVSACLVAASALAGCFDPHFRDDLRCAAEEPACPSGHICGPEGRCWPEGALPDAGADANDGAVPDAAAADAGPGPTAETLSSMYRHTCVTTGSATVRCWGYGEYARLGYGDTENVGDAPERRPADVGDVPLEEVAVEVASGRLHTCALLESGAVRCWGDGFRGQLGAGETIFVGDDPDNLPRDASDVALGAAAVEIGAGEFHTCARLDTGAVRCWGEGEEGKLGYGDEENVGDDPDTLPADVGDVPLGGSAEKLAVGYEHTCALLDSGAVRCWGDGEDGRLGYGDEEHVGDTPDNLPEDVGDVPLGGTAVDVDAGRYHTCAVLDTGSVRCWGRGRRGRLGYGDTENVGDTPDALPEDVGDVPLGGGAATVSSGLHHTCALLESGGVRCWGRAANGRLGYGDTGRVGHTPDRLPEDVGDVPLGEAAREVTASRRHTCALVDTGAVRCWGAGERGRLGYGDEEDIGDTPDNLPEHAGDVPLF